MSTIALDTKHWKAILAALSQGRFNSEGRFPNDPTKSGDVSRYGYCQITGKHFSIDHNKKQVCLTDKNDKPSRVKAHELVETLFVLNCRSFYERYGEEDTSVGDWKFEGPEIMKADHNDLPANNYQLFKMLEALEYNIDVGGDNGHEELCIEMLRYWIYAAQKMAATKTDEYEKAAWLIGPGKGVMV